MLGPLDGEPVDGVVVDHVRDAGEGSAAEHVGHPHYKLEAFKNSARKNCKFILRNVISNLIILHDLA